jgi:hypothetical protein
MNGLVRASVQSSSSVLSRPRPRSRKRERREREKGEGAERGEEREEGVWRPPPKLLE